MYKLGPKTKSSTDIEWVGVGFEEFIGEALEIFNLFPRGPSSQINTIFNNEGHYIA